MSKDILYEGPDISYHNGIVNIKQIRDSGCKRVGIRAGYGKNNVDQKYISNAEACYNLGVNVLLYWFSYAYTMPLAISEAEYAVAQAQKYWKCCPIAFDFEYDSVNYARKNGVDITKSLATNMAIAFLKHVQSAGYIPVIYANRDYVRNYFDIDRISAELGKVYVWYARYTSASPSDGFQLYDGKKTADVWQYTSSGRIAGVSGNVDMNRFYTDFKDDEIEDRDTAYNINIKNFQSAANADGIWDMDGLELVEDGRDGPRTQFVRKQIFLKAKKSGRNYVVGSTGSVVQWWQTRCNEILSYNRKADGLFGDNSRNDTILVQRKLGLKVDGIAGYNSIQAVFYN